MNPARIQPIDIFESTTSANNIKFNELLELPVYFRLALIFYKIGYSIKYLY